MRYFVAVLQNTCGNYDSCVACPHVLHGMIPRSAFVQHTFSPTQSRAYLSAPRLPVPPTYVSADFPHCTDLRSEFMFSDYPDKSPAESTHRLGTAMPPSRRKSFHNELEMALEQDTRRSATSLSSLAFISFPFIYNM